MIVVLFPYFLFTETNLCNTSHWLQEQLANINLKDEQTRTRRDITRTLIHAENKQHTFSTEQ